jgi:ferredoxin
MRITVNQAVCQGHTLCALTAPELFTLSDEDGHASAIAGEVPVELEELAQLAVASCPEQAISIQS